MERMKAIRAWHMSLNTYIKMFCEIAGISTRKQKHEVIQYPRANGPDATDALTELRKGLAAKGYEKEVELADERFLREHRGYKTEEAWEDFWDFFCNNHNLDPRKDAL